jgi:hypothetical protein
VLKAVLRRVALPLAVAAAAWLLFGPGEGGPVAGQGPASPMRLEAGRDPVRQAFEEQARDRLLEASGVVERILADDRDGSPHQRFIIRTDGGISLLVAHNLDLAPRLAGLAPGDRVSGRGEYVWNDKGGVLHWTHDDPAGRHPGGWLDWNGRRYE